jgi:hypothetical protein
MCELLFPLERLRHADTLKACRDFQTCGRRTRINDIQENMFTQAGKMAFTKAPKKENNNI